MYTKIILAALCLVNVGSLSSEERELFKNVSFLVVDEVKPYVSGIKERTRNGIDYIDSVPPESI